MRKITSVTSAPNLAHVLAEYIGRSSNEVRARVGELYHTVWSDYVLSAIKSKPEVRFEILCGPMVDINSFPMLALAFTNNKVRLYRQSDRVGRHYVIFDNFSLALQDPHSPFALKRDTAFLEDFDSLELVEEYRRLHWTAIESGYAVPITRDNLHSLTFVHPDDRSEFGYRKATEDESKRLKDVLNSRSDQLAREITVSHTK